MKTLSTTTLLIAVTLFLSAACSLYSSFTTGQEVPLDNALQLRDRTDTSGTITTSDLTISYMLTPTETRPVLTADIAIHDNVLMTYHSASDFTVYLYYIDAAGVILSRHDVSPNFGYLKHIEGGYPLLDIPPAPEEAAWFAFAYYGTLTEGTARSFSLGNVNDDATTRIFYNPFLIQTQNKK